MTWIRTLSYTEGDDRLKEAMDRLSKHYPPEYGLSAGDSGQPEEGVVAAHSLIPDALYHGLATYGVLMSPELPLTRAQQEMIATVVSVRNRCSF